MNGAPRILIVDESAESRDVLRTLLERRGATTMEVTRPEHAIGLAERFQPNLIVIDAESDHSSCGSATDALRDAAARNHASIVLIGTIGTMQCPISGGQIVSKPYHYGPLIRKIESLLAAA